MGGREGGREGGIEGGREREGEKKGGRERGREELVDTQTQFMSRLVNEQTYTCTWHCTDKLAGLHTCTCRYLADKQTLGGLMEW